MARARLLCGLLLLAALSPTSLPAQDDRWEPYSIATPHLSLDKPAGAEATVSTEVEDVTVGDLTLTGVVRATFGETSVTVYGTELDLTVGQLATALGVNAGAIDLGGRRCVRTEADGVLRTYLLGPGNVYLVETAVDPKSPQRYQLRADHDHIVGSIKLGPAAELVEITGPTVKELSADISAIIEQNRRELEEKVAASYATGIERLRLGLAEGRPIHFQIARENLEAVTQAAPDFAMGHFVLGLVNYYIGDYTASYAAFRRAIRLDETLFAACPLLWWEDYRGEVALDEDRIYVSSDPPWLFDRREREGWLAAHKMGEEDYARGGVVWLFDPNDTWQCDDLVVAARFRFVGTRPTLNLAVRHTPLRLVVLRVTPHDAGTYYNWDHRELSPTVRSHHLDASWHTAVLVVRGLDFRGYVDGELIGGGTLPEVWEGTAFLSFFGSGTTLVDWVLVTRP